MGKNDLILSAVSLIWFDEVFLGLGLLKQKQDGEVARTEACPELEVMLKIPRAEKFPLNVAATAKQISGGKNYVLAARKISKQLAASFITRRASPNNFDLIRRSFRS